MIFPKLVVVVPTLNEEEGLPKVLAGLKSIGATEILVVDGGSKDKTVHIARKSGAQVIMQEGRGKGNAFRTFIAKYPLKADWFYIMLDGDASYDPADLGKVYSALKTNSVVSGVRSTLAYDLKSATHVVGGTAISWFGSVLFMRYNPDICTGYWGFTGSALKSMKITASGFDLEANLFSEAAKRGLKATTVPVSYSKREGESKLTVADALKIVGRLAKDRFSN
jgi:dolichol-phosphate hexosyltransferase